MKLLSIPGAWYCDCTIEQDWIAADEGRETVQTSRGTRLHHKGLQWLSLAADGVRWAGTGSDDAYAWEWDGAALQQREAFEAPRAVLYDAADQLRIVPKGKSWGDGSTWTGSQGFRYVDDAGNLVRAMDSRNPTDPVGAALGLTYLHEYIVHGGIAIGQGPEGVGGIAAIINGTRKRLDPLVGASDKCYAVKFRKRGNDLAVAFYSLPYTAHFLWLTVDELLALPDEKLNLPVEGIGPLTPPRTDDGRAYDLARFIIGDAATWPRRGPTHPMNQVVQGDLLFFTKFAHADAYEMWGTDPNWIYHLEDASNPTTYRFSDPRWFHRTMLIGQSHLFDTGPHQIVFYDRTSKQEIRREPVRRRMWLHAVYDRYNWGPDLGERATAVVVYDTSNGNPMPGRNVELGYYAIGAGSVRWDSYPSTSVYAHGDTAQFNDAERQFRSDFYLMGGLDTQPQLTGCVEPVVPHLPPLSTESGTTLKPPRVSIISYGQEIRDGQPWGVVIEEPNNRSTTTVELIPQPEGGFSVHSQITNAAGSNRSGLIRRVRVIHPEPSGGGGTEPQTHEAVCRRIWREELERGIDPDGLRDCVFQREHGRTEQEQREIVRQSQEYADLQRRKREVMPLAADGKVFRRNGDIWRWRGVSAFKLLDRFAHGEDIQPFLAAYPQANILRVWPYVPWPGTGWESPDEATIRSFLKAVAPRYVELTLLTDDDPGRIPWVQDLMRRLSVDPPSNLLIEIGNEPQTHKSINTPALRSVLDASPFLYSSGDYEDSNRWAGRYYTDHTPRDTEWPRKAKELLEFYDGDGPEKKTVPHRVPCVADEPIKPSEAGYAERDFYTYAALSAIAGAGATFHCETAKYAQPLTADEARCRDAFFAGLNVFQSDAPMGAYRRIDEQGRTLRTYIVGQYMVRVRPTTTDAPESGWTPLDEFGVAWRR